MRKKHYSRQRQQQARRQRRRYAFDETTRLASLFAPRGRKRANKLIRQLSPYLIEQCRNPQTATGLFFEPSALRAGIKTWIYCEIAMAIAPFDDGESPLAVSRNQFFRYLSSPDHSNLRVAEIGIRNAVNHVVTSKY